MSNTHYAVVIFGGDPVGEHPDEERRGRPPSMDMIACGSEDFCWRAVENWTADHPLRMWESIEVLQRDPALVRRPETCS